jgi:hypothetical protein
MFMQHQPRFVCFSVIGFILFGYAQGSWLRSSLRTVGNAVFRDPAGPFPAPGQEHRSLYSVWRIEFVLFPFTGGCSDSVLLAYLEDS